MVCMDSKTILEAASGYFKKAYPGLTAEAVVCFLVIMGMDEGPTVGDVARALGMTEPDTYHHLTLLTSGKGAGLISLENTGDGRSVIHVTEEGKAIEANIQTMFSE